MSRKRSHSFADAAADFHGAFMEPPGAAGRADADFLELEPEEELLCSVSGITEQLGRSITAALQTALADIRRTVSVRIRVLKMELREKSDEIEALKARLELPGGAEPSAEAAFRKPDSRLPDPRRARALMPGVKKENIDAICDYLMKDKNSRGDGDREARHDPDPHPLNLWPDGGMTGSGPGPGDPESATEDLFSILPSGSKRIYDYEWIAPMEYSPDLKVLKEPEGDSEPPATTEEDEEDDEEEDEEEEDPSRREGGGLDHNQNQVQVQVQVPLAHVQTPDFSLEARDSPGEGGSPLGGPDRPETGQPFPSHPYICSLCGTFCPDSLFLEEHMKLIHPDTAGGELQASSSSLVEGGGGAGDARRTPAGAEQNDGGGVASQAGAGPAKKEIKMEGGYECGDCGRHFNYLGNLRQHQRIHTGEKPFACPECGERFRHAARLKSHRLVHSGAQSPFPCPQCGKGFSVLSGLKRHQRVHTGESPYACPQCGRRFKELGNLYTHQRIHSGATPYCCQQCGRSFRHLGTYKSHRCTPLSLQ